MTYLFDATAIINLTKRGLARILAQGETLDLAEYEVLNALWKECILLGRIDEETALEYCRTLAKLFRAIRKSSIEGAEEEVLRLALTEGLTVYDAAYLFRAVKAGLTLVTDDEELKRKARKYIGVTGSEELANIC